MEFIKEIWSKFKKSKIYPYIKWILIVTAVIETLNALLDIDILIWLKNNLIISGPIALSPFILTIIKYLLSCKDNSTNTQSPSDTPGNNDDKITMFDKAIDHLHELIKIAKHSKNICLLIVILIIGSTSVYAAHIHLYGHILSDCLDFLEQIIDYDKPEIEDEPTSDIQESDDPKYDDTSALDRNNIPSNLIERTPPINIDDTSVISKGPVQFLTDPDRHLVITENEESDLFFLEGQYAIDYTVGLESAIDSISNYIGDLRLNSKDSNFDDEAPANVRGKIAYASELEIDMSTSKQLDEVIDIRQSVWDEGYRKYSIAWNSANNMQYYALQYLSIDGNYDTIKYYYYHSIIWCWNAMSFKETDEKTITSTIRYIKMRYHDIMDMAPNSSTDKLQAEIIYKALDRIEDSM